MKRWILRRCACGLACAAVALADAGQGPTHGQTQSQPAATKRWAAITLAGDNLDEASVELLELDLPEVVSATRRPQKSRLLPYAISVITAEDIRRAGVRSVPDALRLAAGVDVAALSFRSAAVSPRGMHGFVARQVLVLVDGRQIYDSWFGGTLWGSWPISLEDIERIEVIRGPAGVSWGANAVNGVINIVTKDPAEQKGLTLRLGGGSRGTHWEYFSYGWRDDKLRMRISGQFDATDGFKRGGGPLARADDDSLAAQLNVSLWYDADENTRWTVLAGHLSLDEGYAPPPTALLRRRAGSQASYVLLRWRRQLEEDNALEITGYVNDFGASNGMQAVDYRYQQLAFQISQTFKPHPDHTVVWGIDSRTDLLDTSNAFPVQNSKDFVATTIVGLYAEDEWRFAPRWTLTLGGRIDYESYGGFEPSGQASLSYEINEDHMVYGTVSRAFQMPPAGARFLRLPTAAGLLFTTFERDARAQRLLAWELGYHGRFADRLRANLALFWHRYRGITPLILRPGPPGLVRLKAENAGRASVYGAELELKYRLTERVDLLGSYTFEQLDWSSRVPYGRTDGIRPPKHKLMLGLRYSPIDRLHLDATAWWVDAAEAPNPLRPLTDRHIPPYWRLDLRAEYEFWHDRASVAVGVRNLLDDHHPEGSTLFINSAQVPRIVYGELRVRYK